MSEKTEEPRIGVYVCHCGTNIGGVVNVPEVVEFASKLPNVVVAREHLYMCSDPGQEMIKKDIREGLVNRVVVASCTHRTHEPIFRECVASAGMNKYLYEQANIRDQCSWAHPNEPERATKKAKLLVASAVAKARHLEPLEEKEVEVIDRALVIGGGIAGINAALDLANMGFKVYLVERNPSIGGRMAQLDKTFPTNDCSACILAPKMVEVANNPNIELLTYSEVQEVSGYIGNFKVRVKKKATYVDWDKCTGCRVCTQECPVRVPNEFNCGLDQRGAIYIQFDQAVPARAVVDKEHCIGCKKCMKVCPAGAVDIEKNNEEIVELEVGTIIVATGFDPFDPSKMPNLNYSDPDVLTALEFERLMCASGPTKGHIERPSDGKKPKVICWVQCVGSRDRDHNPYCSRVCCMYAVKQTWLIKEKYPDIDIYVHYIDMRTPGKDFEEYYAQAREKGVKFIRGKVGEIERKGDKLLVKAEDADLGEPIVVEADMVVLSVGLEPSAGTQDLARLLTIGCGATGWLTENHPKLRPVDTNTDGVYIAGCAQGPKDIPDSVAQGKAAASAAAIPMSAGKIKVEPIVAEVIEELCGGCRTCEEVCPYGAPKIVEKDGKYKSEINPVLCKGCGACVASCPAGAIVQHGFKDEQIRAQVQALTSEYEGL